MCIRNRGNRLKRGVLSNAFKKIMGVSPEKYRKMNINIIQRQANLHNKFTVEATENLPFDLMVERH